MRIYFDTEFTGLHKNTTLISLGMIAETGQTFYAEFNDYNQSQCDDWIKENVIANLKFNHHVFKNKGVDPNFDPEYNFTKNAEFEMKGSKEEVKYSLDKWLSQFKKIELVSDVCHYDMVLFIDIFGTVFDLPKHVSAACHDINSDIAKYFSISLNDAFDMNRKQIVNMTNNANKHNALWDAKVIKRLWEMFCE